MMSSKNQARIEELEKAKEDSIIPNGKYIINNYMMYLREGAANEAEHKDKEFIAWLKRVTRLNQLDILPALFDKVRELEGQAG